MALSSTACARDLGLRRANVDRLGTIDGGNAVVNAVKGAVDATRIGRDVGDAQGITDFGASAIGGELLLELSIGSTDECDEHLTSGGVSLTGIAGRSRSGSKPTRSLSLGLRRAYVNLAHASHGSNAVVNAVKSTDGALGAARYMRDTQGVGYLDIRPIGGKVLGKLGTGCTNKGYLSCGLGAADIQAEDGG